MSLFDAHVTLDHVRHLAVPSPALVALADDEAAIVTQIKALNAQLATKRLEASELLQDVTPRAVSAAVAAKEVARVAADAAEALAAEAAKP